MTLAKMDISVRCPACGLVLYHYPNETMACSFSDCSRHGILYKIPSIELELVEVAEEKTINETIDATPTA